VVALGCATPATAPAPTDQPGNPPPATERTTQPRPQPRPDRSRPIVTAHNEIRAEVGIPPLSWSAPLAKVAQRWANKLARGGCRLDHSTSRYGENLFAASSAVSPEHVVQKWASERKDYNHARNTCRGVCGHYTQIVWANSRSLGCASASCGSTVVWVCNYDPPGNFVGEKPY
jgi:uncharacterized protein YkwD